MAQLKGISIETHGVATILPTGWEDFTIYKFAAPEGTGLDLPGVMKGAAKPKPRFRSNIVVTKHRVPQLVPLEAIFDGPNKLSMEQNPSFKILQAGQGSYSRQPAAWQDLEFFDQGVQLRILQRQIAVKTSAEMLVMFTLTTSEEKIDTLSKEIGFNAQEA